MSTSYSLTETAAFTITDAIKIAAKVATDLKRMQRLYGEPSDARIAQYEAETVALLKAGYLGTVTYGYWRNNTWIEPTLRYSARELAGATASDDDPGRVKQGANISGASFYSFLTYSAAWDRLNTTEQSAFQSKLPFYRGGAPEPGVNGYFSDDRTYSSGGRALNRSSIRSW
jgi:Bacterial HORMA domain family 1